MRAEQQTKLCQPRRAEDGVKVCAPSVIITGRPKAALSLRFYFILFIFFFCDVMF